MWDVGGCCMKGCSSTYCMAHCHINNKTYGFCPDHVKYFITLGFAHGHFENKDGQKEQVLGEREKTKIRNRFKKLRFCYKV